MHRRWWLVVTLALGVIAGGLLTARLVMGSGSCPEVSGPDAGGNAAGPVATSTAAADYWTDERQASATAPRQPDPAEENADDC